MSHGPTPERILDVWQRHPARFIDTFGSDDVVFLQIVDQTAQSVAINEKCQWISDQTSDLGGFVEKFGYQWALSPRAYRLATEAAWQARVFQQLSSLWLHDRSLFPLSRPPQEFSCANMGNVVVRQTFVTSYDLMSPTYRPLEDIHFIILPQSFFDFALLIWRSFATWCQGGRIPEGETAGDQAWSNVVRTACRAGAMPQPDPFLLEAIARDLAQPARDLDVTHPDAAGLIAEQVPFFANAVRVLDSEKLTSFDAQVSYALTDFSLSHELGHRIAGHAAGPRAVSEELDADQIAFDLFLASGGWRSELFANSPLTDLTMPLFGSVAFHQTIRMRHQLQRAVRLRLSEAFPDTPAGYGWGWEEDERRRADQASLMYFNFVKQRAREGHEVDFDAIQSVVNLSENVGNFANYIVEIIGSVPIEDIAAARGLAVSSQEQLA